MIVNEKYSGRSYMDLQCNLCHYPFYKGSCKYSKIRVLKSIEFAEEIAKYILNTFK